MQVALEKVNSQVDVTASECRSTDGDSRGGAGQAAEVAMEEITEETEAAASGTARRARYAHLFNVYELQLERALRQAKSSRNRVKLPSAPQASCRWSR